MHRVVFQNRENNWQNALPLGNGCFGAMAFYKDNALSLPMNHYEVYYNIEKDVLPSDILASSPQCGTPGADHCATHERALRNLPKDGEPFYYYRLDKEKPPKYATAGFSGSYPSTGEMQYVFAPSLKGKNSELSLTVEDATVLLHLDDLLSVSTYIPWQLH